MESIESTETINSMGQGVHDEIHSHAESVPGESVGISGIIRPLISVTEISVVVDDHHQAAVVVPNALAFRLESIGFPGDAPIKRIRKAGSLNQVIDVVHHVKD